MSCDFFLSVIIVLFNLKEKNCLDDSSIAYCSVHSPRSRDLTATPITLYNYSEDLH